MSQLWCVVKRPKDRHGTKSEVVISNGKPLRDLPEILAAAYLMTLSHEDSESYYSACDQRIYEFENRKSS